MYFCITNGLGDTTQRPSKSRAKHGMVPKHTHIVQCIGLEIAIDMYLAIRIILITSSKVSQGYIFCNKVFAHP